MTTVSFHLAFIVPAGDACTAYIFMSFYIRQHGKESVHKNGSPGAKTQIITSGGFGFLFVESTAVSKFNNPWELSAQVVCDNNLPDYLFNLDGCQEAHTLAHLNDGK